MSICNFIRLKFYQTDKISYKFYKIQTKINKKAIAKNNNRLKVRLNI